MNLIYRMLIEITIAVLIGLTLRHFVCVLVHVQGNSMMDTLKNGEILLVRRYSRKRQPRRGDIVICRFGNDKKLYLKRVIGLPGETVAMENSEVLIDGRVIVEPYIMRRYSRRIEPRSLGMDEYFLLGDNRPVSRDSRKLGNISRRAIKGRAVYVIWPFKARRRIAAMEEYQTSMPET